MADLDQLSASNTIKIAGSDSTGTETYFVNANSSGRLLVEATVLEALVKVTSNDQTQGYLAAKVVGKSGETVATVLNPGLSETLEVSLSNAGTPGTYGSTSQVPVVVTDAKGRVTSVTNTNIQISKSQVTNLTTDLAAKQPLDSTLTSLASFNTNGILTQTAADTFTGRTITGTAGDIVVSNGDGVAGNPTIDLASTGTAGTYGSSTQVPVLTTDAKGRVTSVTNTTIVPTLTTFSNSSTGTISTSSQTFQASGISITPNVAGSYLLLGSTEILSATSGVNNNSQVTLAKNGTAINGTTQDSYIDVSGVSLASFGISGGFGLISLVTANGSTDTFDIYYRRVNGSSVTIGQRTIIAIRYA